MRHFPARRWPIAAIAGVLASLAILGTALAWPDILEGKPKNLHPGGQVGYYVWHNDRGMNLATTGPDANQAHIYEGVIETDGAFASIDLIRPENPDGYAVRDGDQRIRFHFKTYAGIDGLNFGIRDGTHLVLRLNIDGQPAATQQIFLGRDAMNPVSNPVVLYR